MIAAMSRHAAAVRIAALLCIALVIGLFTLKDYGESWDEPDNFRYADYSLGAYRFFFHPDDLPPFETDLNTKGPAYFMVAEASGKLLTRAIPAWSLIDARHFIAFTMFLLCGLTIYLMSRRWMKEAAALGATALFLSQPLFWGHAFINPKDTPFMSLFAASILLGFIWVDRLAAGRNYVLALLLASTLLGLTSSIRVIGPLAGLIVFGYAAYMLRRRVFAAAIPYIGLATLTSYVSWPYLWSSPLSHYVESLRTMSQFPFATRILYGGTLWKADGLPWTYFPKLLTLQLTEPALIAIAGGVIASVHLWLRDKKWQPLGLFLAWFLLPLTVILILRSPLYDNGRQLYFLLPPLFILGGNALDRLFKLISHPAWQGAALLFMALPGILVGARLHPYEYVYYNAFIGGTGGAFRKFEMDYWGISLKELSERMNATVPANSRVLVFGPEQTVALYARPDVQVFIPGEQTQFSYGYVILLTRENLDERRCKNAPTVDEVGRRGAVFAVLKQFRAGPQCP